ncbi:MAG: regulatory protein RecX [Armatimonadetes bacterium]|nr:regulatory protein RecX [Armatimonadota bacterium]
METDTADAKLLALRLLSRREHTRKELRRKLSARGFCPTVVEQLLDWLVERDYLCDQRFAEAFVRGRSSRGYAPARMVQELTARGIERELAREIVQGTEPPDLLERAVEVARSRSSSRGAEQVYRFLRRRGFDHGVATRAVASLDGDDCH